MLSFTETVPESAYTKELPKQIQHTLYPEQRVKCISTTTLDMNHFVFDVIQHIC